MDGAILAQGDVGRRVVKTKGGLHLRTGNYTAAGLYSPIVAAERLQRWDYPATHLWRDSIHGHLHLHIHRPLPVTLQLSHGKIPEVRLL